MLNTDISGRSVFIEGAKGDFIGDVHEAILLSDLLPNPSEEPLRFVDISSPLYDKDGKFKGVLAAHLITAAVRSSEILFRIGGDEFLIALIVPGMSLLQR